MDVTTKWAYDLAAAEIATGRRYEVGVRLTEYDGREQALAARERLTPCKSMLRGEVGGDYTTIRVAWTYVTDEMRAIADRIRPEIEQALRQYA